MRSALRSIVRKLGRLVPSGKAAKSSKLFGIYLAQANTKGLYSTQIRETRERRNGKYSHNRERA
jgi:hypothetical protein